ncbi:hypothetical protein T492DRAFT_845690 [Pavlovales sp. CCMP2436]|nr:hypothetical protein T492DRAFT_845690 [Pavlovales sp. CCMP2436]
MGQSPGFRRSPGEARESPGEVGQSPGVQESPGGVGKSPGEVADGSFASAENSPTDRAEIADEGERGSDGGGEGEGQGAREADLAGPSEGTRGAESGGARRGDGGDDDGELSASNRASAVLPPPGKENAGVGTRESDGKSDGGGDGEGPSELAVCVDSLVAILCALLGVRVTSAGECS